jgi:hypothetical protein
VRGKTQVKIHSKIDEIIAYDCPLCGQLMIRNIDKVFFQPGKLQEELDKWQ